MVGSHRIESPRNAHLGTDATSNAFASRSIFSPSAFSFTASSNVGFNPSLCHFSNVYFANLEIILLLRKWDFQLVVQCQVTSDLVIDHTYY